MFAHAAVIQTVVVGAGCAHSAIIHTVVAGVCPCRSNTYCSCGCWVFAHAVVIQTVVVGVRCLPMLQMGVSSTLPTMQYVCVSVIATVFSSYCLFT